MLGVRVPWETHLVSLSDSQQGPWGTDGGSGGVPPVSRYCTNEAECEGRLQKTVRPYCLVSVVLAAVPRELAGDCRGASLWGYQRDTGPSGLPVTPMGSHVGHHD